MKRIAVLGNSHVACVKNAWDERGRNFQDFQLVFFADRGTSLDGLVVQKSKLLAVDEDLARRIGFTSGGRTEVDPLEYDAFLLVGLGLTLEYLSSETFSRAVFRQAAVDSATASTSVMLARRLRSISDKPILVVPCPLLAVRPDSPAVEPRLLAEIVGVLRQMIFDPIGVQFVEQPASSIAKGFWTKHKFSSGAGRLDLGDGMAGQIHPVRDRKHMNTAYGRLLLQIVLKHEIHKHRRRDVTQGFWPWLRKHAFSTKLLRPVSRSGGQ